MLSEIKTRYSQSLKRSETFLKSKKTTVKSSSITSTRELCLLRNQAECPICAIKFSGKNHNTEHIHPRALGGLNVDENKIQMCTACNNSRNLTMQSLLGNPPYYKNYQNIKADVNEFILWSEVTADDGLLAGSVFRRAQEIFTEARFANSEPPIPQRAYGRFSTWDKEDPPNLKLNKVPFTNVESKSKPVPSKPGAITRFFDWIFDYKPPKTKSSPESHQNPKTKNNSSRIDDNELSKESELNPKHFDKSNSQVKFQLLDWIKLNWKDEESYPLLKDAILTHEEKNNRGRNLKDILKEDFDIPKSWTIAKRVSYWNELILGEVKTEHDASDSKKNQRGKVDGYRVITYLNSSSKGLRYPKEPKQFALSWDWFIENAMNYTTYQDCLGGLKEADILPKSRGVIVLRTILRAYCSDGSFESLSEQDLHKDKGIILDEILRSFKSSLADQTNLVYILEREKFMVEIEDYFRHVIREFETDNEQGKFKLLDWLKLNWKGQESYPLLKDAILTHEEKNNGGRSLKDILKNDFNIPKNWTIAKKASYWNELVS